MSRLLGSLLLLTTAAITTYAQVTTTAVCGSGFGWMFNSENQSPCLVAGYLSATCGNGVFKVDALPAGNNKYNPPTVANNTANGCSCSWAAYNLFSACTLCQSNPALNWATYDQGCTGFLSDSTFFPANETIPSETSIPYWAGINPTTWQDGRFNVAQAQAYASQNHSDYNGTNSTTPSATSSSVPSATSTASSKSSSSVGPIVGGVIGGLAALAIAGVCAYFFLYRRRRINSQETLRLNGGPGHFRSVSDTTQKSSGNAVQHLMAVRADATSPTSSYTHVQSLSGHSLVTTAGLPQTATTLQARIDPFVGVPGNPELRKGASAARATTIGFNEVYEDHQQPTPDQPNPISFEQAEQATGTNPPPYAEASDPSTSQTRVDEFGHRRLRGEMGSGETLNSRTTGAGSGGGSGSSLAQMGILRGPNLAGSAGRPDLGQAPREADEPEL